MSDHWGFAAADLSRSRAFSEKALALLGIEVVADGDHFADMVSDGRQLGVREPIAAPGASHLPRSAANLCSFYETALAGLGKDSRAPGLRPNYHPNYYGAFVIDPSRHNIEAVCHGPET